MIDPKEHEAVKAELEGYKIKELQERVDFLQGELSKQNISGDWLAERVIKKVADRNFQAIDKRIKESERAVHREIFMCSDKVSTCKNWLIFIGVTTILFWITLIAFIINTSINS